MSWRVIDSTGNTKTRAVSSTNGLALNNTWTGLNTFNGGTNINTTDVFANRPAAGKKGNVFLPTDGFSIAEDSGTSWVPFGPIFPLTAPVDANYSWVNQLTAATTQTKDAVVMTSGNAAATNEHFCRVLTAPATPYTITAAFLAFLPAVDFFGFGLMFRDSVSGNIVFHKLDQNSSIYANGFIWSAEKWTSPTTFSASYTLTGSLVRASGIGQLVWMRIGDDGVNRNWFVSGDGQNWTNIFQVSRTDFLTANQVGWFIYSNNANYGNIPVTLLSWKQG